MKTDGTCKLLQKCSRSPGRTMASYGRAGTSLSIGFMVSFNYELH
jgi:hypothetical protein